MDTEYDNEDKKKWSNFERENNKTPETYGIRLKSLHIFNCNSKKGKTEGKRNIL